MAFKWHFEKVLIYLLELYRKKYRWSVFLVPLLQTQVTSTSHLGLLRTLLLFVMTLVLSWKKIRFPTILFIQHFFSQISVKYSDTFCQSRFFFSGNKWSWLLCKSFSILNCCISITVYISTVTTKAATTLKENAYSLKGSNVCSSKYFSVS